MIRQCPVCKKQFDVLYPELRAYHVNRKIYYCTWRCFRRKDDLLMNMLTKEQKEEAVRIAAEGGDQIRYLTECGAKNANATWFNIRKKLEKEDPETYDKIQKAQHNRVNRKYKAKQKAEALQLDGGVNYEVSVDEGLAAEVKCVNEKNRPLTFDGIEIAALRHQDLGEFYYDTKFNSVDWRTPEGDEVSMGPAWWKQMITELPKILKLLGVDA